MVEIIINGINVDLDENTNVTMSVYSNFIGDLDNIKASRTYTISLPRTRKNDKAFGILSDITSISDSPYKKYDSQIFIDGFEITNNAKAYISSTRRDSIDVIIAWNTTNVFTKIGSMKMLDIITKFPALYDYLPFNSAQTFFKPESEINDTKGYFYYISNTGNIVDDNVRFTHPCVSAKYILQLLETAFNIEFTGFDMDLMNYYLFPCVTKHASRKNRILNGLTMTSLLVNSSIPYRISPGDIFHPYQILTVYNRNGWDGNPSTTNNSYYDNSFASSFTIKGNIICSGANELTIRRYDPTIPATGSVFFSKKTNESNVIVLDDEIEYNSTFVISLLVNNLISTGLESTLSITPELDECQYANRGEFDILANLPDMKISEFIADICAITGTYPQGAGYDISDNTKGILRFIKYSDISSSNSVDWSGKVSAVKDISYMDSEKSAKSILFDFAHDDIDDVSFGESITVNNEIVPENNEFFDMALTGMNGNSIKLYKVNGDMTRELNDIKPKIGYKIIKNIEDVPYLHVTGLNENVRFNNAGILSQKYGLVKSILQRYKMVTAILNLNAIDIFKYNTSKLVYIKELGGFFMVISLDYDVREKKSEVKMIQIQ